MAIAFVRDFAIQKHGDQKYGDKPFVYHLDAVAELSDQLTGGEFARKVAYLHDVLEDTDATFDEIALLFGEPIAICVDLLTDPPGETRAECKRRMLARIRRLGGPDPHVAAKVKLADRLANVRECAATGNAEKLAMYREEHAEFREAIGGKCDLRPRWAWQELDSLLGVDQPALACNS